MLQPSDSLRGILLLIASVSLFGVVDGLSKILVETQSFGQIMLARYSLALPFLLIITQPNNWSKLFSTKHFGLQLLRGIAPLVVGGSMVIAVRYLPLAEATVILFAGPFIVVLLSTRYLGEKVRISSWIGVAVGFLAVILVARPGFTDLSKYTIFPLIAAIFYALFQLQTRKLAAMNEQPLTILAWTLVVGVIASTPIAVANWAPMSANAWLLSISLGVVFGLAQLLMVRAFMHAPANLLAPFSYTQIIAATIFGLLVFHDFPDAWTIVGMLLIVAAGTYVMQSSK